jgi:phosphohistidine swiveling domain-containing protein
MTHLLWPEDTVPEGDDALQYGGKAAALRRMAEADLPIPPWFVVTPEAYRDSRLMFAPAQSVEPSEQVCEELKAAMERLCPDGEPVAVRSSAVDEDGTGHSFAGQLDSFLWVSADDVAARVADVWKSGFSERIVAYRKERGLSPEPAPPAVLIQRMVDADAAGVAFSADPVTGRRGVALVAGVWGLGTALVGGDADADTYEVGRDGKLLTRRISVKTSRHRPAPGTKEGVREEPIPAELADKPAMTDGQIVAIAELARRAERHAGRPQDIEWARKGETLYLLQSRPVTTLARMKDPDALLQVWDNSNIAESYNGITTPLTFSFARNAYEHVYREFCRLLSVPEAKIAGAEQSFRNLLGLIRGRVYYNLPNWYRLLALLPGYKMNRAFMEQMMGVREPLPEEIVGVPTPPTFEEKWRDGVALTRSILGLIGSHRALPRQIDRFYGRLNTALAPSTDDLARMHPDELAAHYHDLEKQLLVRWDAPLVTDFFAMMFHGLLRRLTEKWVKGPGADGLHNDLVSGEGGIISAEPAQRVEKMAKIAAGNEKVIRLLSDLPARDALRAVRREAPELGKELDSYLDKFGDRCLEELKLESATLVDDPTPLVRAVGGLAARGGGVTRAEATGTASPREQAEARVQAAIAGNPMRRWLYGKVLRNARDHVRNRENLRFERTRVFGRVRRIFLEIGRRFHAEGMMDDPRDIFYLEVNEALGIIEGTATCTDIRGLVEVRRANFETFRTLPAPADRLETRGVVAAGGNDYQGSREADTAPTEGDTRQGLACCPGVVRGMVRVITDPRGATLEPGTILVAERTDPGWILLFPSASALLVERGSLLSHSAIVAREMRIPAIVSVPGVTVWLKDGDEVEMDGSTGVVRKLAAEVGDGEEPALTPSPSPNSGRGEPEQKPEPKGEALL